MDTFIVVTVLGRPSADTSEFFNSIKFYREEVQALDEGAASEQVSDVTHEDPAWRLKYLSDGYQVVNWYAFKQDTTGYAFKA